MINIDPSNKEIRVKFVLHLGIICLDNITVLTTGCDITCPSLSQPEEVVFASDQQPRFPVRYGQQIDFSCISRGYQLQGNQSIRCLNNGMWSADPPTCEIRRCLPVAPVNGEVVDTRPSYVSGNIIQYRCNVGYKLEGNGNGRCNENGTWGALPNCVVYTYFAQAVVYNRNYSAILQSPFFAPRHRMQCLQFDYYYVNSYRSVAELEVMIGENRYEMSNTRTNIWHQMEINIDQTDEEIRVKFFLYQGTACLDNIKVLRTACETMQSLAEDE